MDSLSFRISCVRITASMQLRFPPEILLGVGLANRVEQITAVKEMAYLMRFTASP